MREKLFAAVLLMAVFSGALSAQETMTPQESLEYYIGTWETEYSYPGLGDVREETRYWWGEDKNTVLLEVKVYNKEGEMIDSGEGWIKYNPETGETHNQVNSTAMNEVYTSKEIKREGNEIWFEGEGGQMMPHYRVKMTYKGPDTMGWAIFIPQDEAWTEMMSIDYHRVKE
jgi:hypothetical protein